MPEQSMEVNPLGAESQLSADSFQPSADLCVLEADG
jgi:hypothetical protein